LGAEPEPQLLDRVAADRLGICDGVVPLDPVAGRPVNDPTDHPEPERVGHPRYPPPVDGRGHPPNIPTARAWAHAPSQAAPRVRPEARIRFSPLWPETNKTKPTARSASAASTSLQPARWGVARQSSTSPWSCRTGVPERRDRRGNPPVAAVRERGHRKPS